MYESTFFREMTLRICSSLDIKIAVEKTFYFLKEHMPIDQIFLDILDENIGSIRRIVEFPLTKSKNPEIVPLPKRLWEWVERLENPILMSCDTIDDLGVEMRDFVKMKGNSDLTLPLRIDKKLIGMLIFRASGDNRYSKEHVKLLKNITEPAALALANALSHDKVVRYRDALLNENLVLEKALRRKGNIDEIIGSEGGLRDIMAMVCHVAPLSSKVLLLGETGTGKEVIANAIHSLSPRAEGPFVKVNCGAIPEALIDSELFGHAKGAFTGAIAGRRGRFERASGGTLFLDEIGELSLNAQVRLLRVLQTQEIEPVGGSQTIKVDIRLIAATHKNLEGLVQRGRFREDLWYRLNVFPIPIPPLRQRKEDIPALVNHFLTMKCKEFGMRLPPPIEPGALQRLEKYHWPGNVRELENIVERDLIRYRNSVLPLDISSYTSKSDDPAKKYPTLLQQLASLDNAMASHIKAALESAKGKIHGPGGAAEILGINASTLRNRMNKLGISYGKRNRNRGSPRNSDSGV